MTRESTLIQINIIMGISFFVQFLQFSIAPVFSFKYSKSLNDEPRWALSACLNGFLIFTCRTLWWLHMPFSKSRTNMHDNYSISILLLQLFTNFLLFHVA